MKSYLYIIFLLFIPSLCFAQFKPINNEDYRFVVDQTPILEMQYPKRKDIPKDCIVFYALTYDETSGTAFIYNEFICGYYDVPNFMISGFKAGARNLQRLNPKKYNNDVENIMSAINDYWQKKDSINKVQKDLVTVKKVRTGDDKIYDVVENMPTFKGGNAQLMAYLSKSIKYPVNAEKKNKQGRVVCTFVVMEDGSISDIEIVHSSSNEELDYEAIRVIKNMPKWNPGTQGGIPVKVRYTLPVTFRL